VLGTQLRKTNSTRSGLASMKRHCSGAASADGKPDIASAIEMQAASFM
jgi:hypothetical protein